MRDIIEREAALNLYFRQGKSHTAVANELGIPRDTVKSWTRRYRIENGIPARLPKYDNELMETNKESIKVKRTYKPREKSSEKSTEERIVRLEMEVDLLRNFLLERERRSIKE
jgi:transposase-like protein